MLKFIEVIKYGDFDMPYTHSIWSKEIAGGEAELNKNGLYEKEMIKDFQNLTGLEMTLEWKNNLGVHENIEEELFIYLKARGYKSVKATTITLHD